MPTPEEIKSICTEYVDELFAYDDMSEQENIEAKNDAFVMVMAFAGHILEKHCIVPKSKLAEKIKNTKWMKDHGRAFEAEVREDLITALFGTELFNEERKYHKKNRKRK